MKRSASRAVGFVIPDLGRPSGGTVYDDRVAGAWPAAAPALDVVRLRHPSPTAPRLLEGVLREHEVTLVDALIGSEHPGLIRRARDQGRAVVLIMHLPRSADSSLSRRQRERLAPLEADAVLAATRVVVPSHWAAADLRSRYGRSDLVVAAPGVDSAPLAVVHEPPVIVQLGAIGPLKNQALAVQAARACRDLDFVLRVVGPVVDGGYAVRLARACQQLGGRASVEPPVDVAARGRLLAGADLVLSLGVPETYGLTVTEATARGIPAIVGRGTGAEEALLAGGALAGQAVATDGPVELAVLLRAFLSVPEVRQRWREAAMAARRGLPSWCSTAQAIADACRSAQDELRARVVP